MNDVAPAQTNRVFALVRLLRPLDWIKNTFVFAGLVFSHKWAHWPTVQEVLVAFAGFCLAASSVYVLNDFLDREGDALHPKKKNRPLAAGTIAPGPALAYAALLLAAGIILAHQASELAAILIGSYALLNVAYAFRLKRVVVLDVFIIAAGFVLRILVGTVGVGIQPSPWILLCGLTLALFLGFCKRRAELATLGDNAGGHRSVLNDYTPAILDHMIIICAGCAILSYSLYTIDPETRATHNTEWLISTIPFVIYGVFRYIYRLHRRMGGTRAATDLLSDLHLLGTVAGWLVVTFYLLVISHA